MTLKLSFPGQIKQVLTNLKNRPARTIPDLPAPASHAIAAEGCDAGAYSRRGCRSGKRAQCTSRNVVFSTEDVDYAFTLSSVWQLARGRVPTQGDSLISATLRNQGAFPPQTLRLPARCPRLDCVERHKTRTSK